MPTHTFDPAAFRQQFAAFTDPPYSDQALGVAWDMATCHLKPDDWCGLSGDCLQYALNLMTAHIATQMQTLATAQPVAAGAVSSATIDRVSVTVTVPPVSDGWQAWLSSTPYGLMLWSLLSTKAASGFYVGGWPERAGFRKAGGVF